MDLDAIRERREFLRALGMTAGGVLLLPHVTSCASETSVSDAPAAAPSSNSKASSAPPLPSVPKVRPDGWDPIAFNKERGNAGAIPESYHGSINGPDGENAHLGKHLPYLVDVEGAPDGFAPLMWGDPDKGHARHPNAPRNESNDMEGHWYNWIRVRKAVDGEAEELESTFSNWPTTGSGDNGQYVALGGDIEADGGKNTVYLVAMPSDVKAGDTVRIWAHCLTHGEYVDFITV